MQVFSFPWFLLNEFAVGQPRRLSSIHDLLRIQQTEVFFDLTTGYHFAFLSSSLSVRFRQYSCGSDARRAEQCSNSTR
jgi:hypothetical protein